MPRGPNVIVDWISEMLASPDYSDTTAKLLKIVTATNDTYSSWLAAGLT